MSAYRPYPKTKPSGVEWLGDVPAGWDLRAIKRLFRIRKRIAGELGYDVLSITQKGLKVKDVTSGDGQLSMDYSKYQLVYPGDFAMNQMDLLTGSADISSVTGVTSPDYRVFTLEDRASHDRYLLHVLRLCYTAKIFYPLGQGAAQIGRWRLPSEAFNEFIVPVPSLPEQVQIATFIDRECGKLETLQAKQERLIELLKEKRQALISHTATKGLDPSAKLKPSGIEWLGDVPEHWDVMALRRILLEHRQGYYTQSGYVDSGVKLLRITDLQAYGGIDFSDCPQVENLPELQPFLLRQSDFVFARTGGAGTFGLVSSIKEPIAYASYLIRFRFTARSEAEFLRYFFLSSSFQEPVKQNIHGGVNQNIHAEDIKDRYIALPPLPEQRAIVAYLDDRCGRMDALIAKAERAIALLKERRSALISAAVTGKIDVRDEPIPASHE